MSFFNSIKNYWSQDYGGRYVSIVLKELFLHDNSVVNKIFGQKIDFKSVEVEYSLLSKRVFDF